VNSYPQCNAVVNKAAETVVGAARTGKPQKTMGAEDFSYFLQERPGRY
jgi:metal-dependent amidase/aminoacylase/carboxypeptidase family protein